MRYTPNPDSYVGLRVQFMLNEGHVKAIAERRMSIGKANYSANGPREGDIVAGVIVQDWYHPTAQMDTESTGDWLKRLDEASKRRAVNIQLHLDGTDTFWVTSMQQFDPTIHVSMLKPQTVEEIEDGDEPERTNVYVHGKQTVEYWEDQGYSDPEPDARGHWWFPTP